MLQEREREYANDLIENVVQRASGVFLWVYLVVSSLLNGIRPGDRISDLQRRLDQLPSDLETFFDRVLINLDPFYLNHAARYFLMVLACRQPPETLLLSFVDEEDPDFVLPLSPRPLSPKDVSYRIKMMRRRPNSLCKELIVIPKLNTRATEESVCDITVQYLHKTVKDCIEQSDVQKKLFDTMDAPFDPHIRLCQGVSALWKMHKCAKLRNIILPSELNLAIQTRNTSQTHPLQ